MGVYVSLYVIPNRIPESEWKTAFEEAVNLAYAFTPALVALRREKVKGVERLVYSRRLLDEDGAMLRISGDAETLECAEGFWIPSRRPRPNGSGIPTDKEIFTLDEDRLQSVFNEKTQGYPYHKAIAAIGALFESRFPQGARASGDLDRETCEEAITWANTALETPIQIPVCVDPERLSARLRAALPRREVCERFGRVLRGSRTEEWDAHVQFLADIEAPEDALARDFKTETGGINVGVLVSARAWLNATEDLAALVRAGCENTAGPHWQLADLMKVLGRTWALLAPEETRALEKYQEEGMIGSTLGIFGAFYPEYHLHTMLGCYRPGLAEAVRIVAETLDLPVENVRAEAESMLQHVREEIALTEKKTGEDLAASRAERVSKHSDEDLGGRMQGFREQIREVLISSEVPVDAMTLRKMVIAGAANINVVLTEDAWATLDGERNVEALLSILVFMPMASDGNSKFLQSLLQTGEYRSLAGERG